MLILDYFNLLLNPSAEMSKDYNTLPPEAMRRQDRAVTDEAWIRAFLKAAPYGVLATTAPPDVTGPTQPGQPFLNSNLFVYDEAEHVLYLHTARTGRTPSNIAGHLQANAPNGGALVCFSAFRMGRLLPADAALEFSVEYESVVVFGQAFLVEDDAQATTALQQLLDKYAPHLRPGRDYHPINADELKRTAVYRIQIDSWTGKRKEVAPDFPGAFTYSSDF